MSAIDEVARVDGRVGEERRDAEVARVAVRDRELRLVEEQPVRPGLADADGREQASEGDRLDRRARA